MNVAPQHTASGLNLRRLASRLPAPVQTGVRLSFASVGAWRAHLLMRAFGFVFALLELNHLQRLFYWRFTGPIEVTLLPVAGVVLLVVGSRFIAVIPACAVGLAFLVKAIPAESGPFKLLADEYILYFLVPFLALVFVGIEITREVRRGTPLQKAFSSNAADDAIALSFRLHIVIAFFFAGLHKFNSDFFQMKMSCLKLNRRLTSWWRVPSDLIDLLRPWHIAVGEILGPVVLLLAPRVGILVVIAMVSGFAHIGPVAFAACCITMSLSFLRREDGAAIRRAYFRVGWFVLPILGIATIAVSSWLYVGKRSHLDFVLYELFVVNALFIVAACLAEDVRTYRAVRSHGAGTMAALFFAIGPSQQDPPNDATAPLGDPPGATSGSGVFGRPSRVALVPLRSSERTFWPRAKVLRWVFGVVIVLQLINGFSPYLGLKYRLSFAMLSNLRVDDVRWNHFFITRRMRVYPRDALINVVEVKMSQEDRAIARAKRLRLAPVLTVGWALDRSLRAYAKAGINHVDIAIDDEGIVTRYPDAPFHPDLSHRLRQERVYGRLFQKSLRPKGMQTCIH